MKIGDKVVMDDHYSNINEMGGTIAALFECENVKFAVVRVDWGEEGGSDVRDPESLWIVEQEFLHDPNETVKRSYDCGCVDGERTCETHKPDRYEAELNEAVDDTERIQQIDAEIDRLQDERANLTDRD